MSSCSENVPTEYAAGARTATGRGAGAHKCRRKGYSSHPMSRVLTLLLLLFTGAASAAPGTRAVAVMPFKDLSGSHKPVGEAIRESVTSDLRSVPGVRVVERSEIDRVISEQKLQASEIDADPLATLRIGKLLGADLMTVGAYQQVGSRVRLTARFVNVETGEVVGTAKVDGAVSEFLKLQDRITIELLKSARLSPQAAERLARRARPKLRNLRPVELYGRAASEKDEAMKAALLKEVVREAPQYSYATDDLSRLEKKLRELEVRRKKTEEEEFARAQAAFDGAGTPEERWNQALTLRGYLVGARRYHAVLALAQKLAREMKAPDQVATVRVWEIDALFHLRRTDEVLKKGEHFVTHHADAPMAPLVKSQLEQVINQRRQAEAGKALAKKAADEIRGERRWNLCQLAWAYERHHQHTEATRLYQGCLAADTGDKEQALQALARISANAGDFKSARQWLAALEELSPSVYQQARSLELVIPSDG